MFTYLATRILQPTSRLRSIFRIGECLESVEKTFFIVLPYFKNDENTIKINNRLVYLHSLSGLIEFMRVKELEHKFPEGLKT